MNDQIVLGLILLATIITFVAGRWRHDMVAMTSLLACVLAGLVPAADAFAGFGHPAVVTVACVLILGNALQQTGAIDALTRRIVPASAGPSLTIGVLTALVALLSSFMNNVGALALLMPVAIHYANRAGLPPGRVLMPLAFGSLFGGMTTLIGTPPNLIVAGFRAQASGTPFAMFDFTPVGLGVTVVGVAFIALVGWRLIPVRERAGAASFASGHYLTEVRLDEGAKCLGSTVREARAALSEADAQIVALVRNEVRLLNPHPSHRLRAGDILSVVADPSALSTALTVLGVKFEEDKPTPAAVDSEAENGAGTAEDGSAATVAAPVPPAVAGVHTANASADAAEGEQAIRDNGNGNGNERNAERARRDDEILLAELAVLPQSALVGRSAADIRLRHRYGVNLLAVSRQDRRPLARLRAVRFIAGDVLLVQGSEESIGEFASANACVPLAQRDLRIPDRNSTWIAASVMVLAIASAAFGLLPVTIAFTLGVLVLMATRVVSPRNAYDAVDWPVIVLLAALLPVAGALESSGAAAAVARLLLDHLAQGNAVIALAAMLIVTMTLSDVLNNAATAAIMCPIAIDAARQLDANPDAFLMAVAIGASCAFLTPIGHQNNTLILGPGGFRFGDYWRLGLPLEIIVAAVSLPLLLLVWPL